MTHFKSKCIKTENLGIKSPPSLLGVSFTKGDLPATKTKQALTEAEGRIGIASHAWAPKPTCVEADVCAVTGEAKAFPQCTHLTQIKFRKRLWNLQSTPTLNDLVGLGCSSVIKHSLTSPCLKFYLTWE